MFTIKIPSELLSHKRKIKQLHLQPNTKFYVLIYFFVSLLMVTALYGADLQKDVL